MESKAEIKSGIKKGQTDGEETSYLMKCPYCKKNTWCTPRPLPTTVVPAATAARSPRYQCNECSGVWNVNIGGGFDPNLL